MIKILIVDDTPARYAKLVEAVNRPSLLDEGIEVASNLRDALANLESKQYDVLILDMFLPYNPWGEAAADSGLKLLEHLDEDPDLKTPKYIIGITASADEKDPGGLAFDSRPWVLVRTSNGAAWEPRLIALIQHAIDCEDAEGSTAYGSDVCLLTALKDPEYSALIRSGAEFSEPVLMDSLTFVQEGVFHSNGQRLAVVATSARRMGATESALMTTKLIARYRPRIVGMAGICAGFEEKVAIGDVIVASPCWDYMMSSRITADADGARSFSYAPDYIEIDSEIASRFEQLAADHSFLSKVYENWPAEKPRNLPQIKIAPSATGPAVMADGEIFRTLRREQNRNVVGLEMEAHGVYSAVRSSTRPRPLVFSAKAVCDFANFLKEDRYQRYAAYVSASVVHEFLVRYASDLCSD